MINSKINLTSRTPWCPLDQEEMSVIFPRRSSVPTFQKRIDIKCFAIYMILLTLVLFHHHKDSPIALQPLTGSLGGLRLCHLLTSEQRQLLKLCIVVGFPDSEFLRGSPQTEQPQAADNGFIKKLKAHIQQLRATPTSIHSAKPTFVYRDLSVCSHVFLRVDAVQLSLSQPYTGPYKVLSRTNKNFTILKDNKKATVTTDRLKPAHLLLDNVNSSESKLESPRVDTSSPTPSAKEPEKSAMPLPEKSSMLLRQMQDLAGNRVGDELLRSL
ncbi:hypothetical protein AVEN_30801-1 [Araneus ventricosus]|uniref:Uncharacterized protein n=1 Tax=Araneus ventricosus TaxID=182803 RepID=A0A4Y2KS66_ARAVE|nr:hypothetical protein AVEN_30801-1 [Araneus ventricosus]